MPNQPKESMRDLINRLALQMALANPDAGEALALALGPASRSAKVGGLDFGISLRVNTLTGLPELRGGDLRRGYVEPEEGEGVTYSYSEVIGYSGEEVEDVG